MRKVDDLAAVAQYRKNVVKDSYICKLKKYRSHKKYIYQNNKRAICQQWETAWAG